MRRKALAVSKYGSREGVLQSAVGRKQSPRRGGLGTREVEADSVPKLFYPVEDSWKRLVVREELDLAWAVKEYIVVYLQVSIVPRKVSVDSLPPKLSNPSWNHSQFSSSSSNAYSTPPFGPSSSCSMTSSSDIRSLTSRPHW